MNEILKTIFIIGGYYFLYKFLVKKIWGGRMKTIKLNDYELNLLHGLLADEEIRLKKAYKILSGHEDKFENTKKYIEEVNKLRNKFTEIDDTEDYFEVADRIADYSLDDK